MRKMKKLFIRLLLLNKRILKKQSFLVILCSIPFLVMGVGFMAKQDSGMLKIVLCSEAEEDELATEIIAKLEQNDNIIQFVRETSTEDAKALVQNGQADAAWIFPENMQESLEAYLESGYNEKGIVTVIEKEDNVALHLAREVLFGAIYNTIAYTVYSDFVTGELLQETDITEEALQTYYKQTDMAGSMFVFSYLDGTEGKVDTSYLLFPIRGILALVIALCGLAMGLYFLQDEQQGIFTWMPLHTSAWKSWLYFLPGLLNVSLVVLIALMFSGAFTDFFAEIGVLLLFLLMVAGFSDVVRRLCGKSIRLGALIPILVLVMLAVSPIFMGAPNMKWIQIFIPTYYYLNAIHNVSYRLAMLVYIVVVYATDCLLIKFDIKFKKGGIL